MRELLAGLRFVAFGATATATPLVVGSKRFTDCYVLGEIVRQTLAEAGAAAKHKPGLGNTGITEQAPAGGAATVAAFVGAGGLGERIVAGLAVNDRELMPAGALPAALPALLVQATFDFAERRLTPGAAAGRATIAGSGEPES